MSVGLPVRVVFVGQGRWSDTIVAAIAGLREERVIASAVPLDKPIHALSLRGLRALARADVIVRVGFRPGADTTRGRLFEWYWRLIRALNRRARVIIYWIGTDVANAAAQVARGADTSLMRRLSATSGNFAGNHTLVDELDQIGIRAVHVGVPWTTAAFPEDPPPLPEEFSVLTYLPDARAAFYGGHAIASAARSLSHISFTVLGGTGTWLADKPDNVRFLGWQQETGRFFGGASVVVRLVEHDAIGGTVIEGLLWARHVIYSEELPHTIHVPFGDEGALMQALTSLFDKHRQGALLPNIEGQAWAQREFDPRRRACRLVEQILKDAPTR